MTLVAAQRRRRAVPLRRLAVLLGFSVLLLGLAPAGTADVPSLEHKRIPSDMVEAVKSAVARATTFLRGAQEPDGGWSYGSDEGIAALAAHNAGWRAAFSCMVGVALARAGARPGDPVIDRLVAFLERSLASRATGGSRATFLAKTYGAAAFLWFLAEARSSALHEDAAVATLALTNGPVEGALWGYELPDVTVRDGYGAVAKLPPAVAGPADLSNSQFAILGLLAAERLGILRTKTVWERVHASLRRIVNRDGGYGYRFRTGEPVAFTRSARSSTAIAAACAFLAARRAGARSEEASHDPLVQKALHWLEQHPFSVRAGGIVDTSEPTDAVPGRLPYYDLLAIERLGAFTGLDDIAGSEWYRTGGKHLLRTQQPDGGWPPGTGGSRNYTSALNAVFAVIFLTRAADEFPVTSPTVTASDVAGLADVPDPLFSEVAALGVTAASHDATTPEEARVWREALFAAGPRVLGILVSKLAAASEAERAYALRTLAELVDRAQANLSGDAALRDWTSWYGANRQRIVADPATRRFRAAPN